MPERDAAAKAVGHGWWWAVMGLATVGAIPCKLCDHSKRQRNQSLQLWWEACAVCYRDTAVVYQIDDVEGLCVLQSSRGPQQ